MAIALETGERNSRAFMQDGDVVRFKPESCSVQDTKLNGGSQRILEWTDICVLDEKTVVLESTWISGGRRVSEVCLYQRRSINRLRGITEKGEPVALQYKGRLWMAGHKAARAFVESLSSATNPYFPMSPLG